MNRLTLDPATAASSLGVELGLGEVDEDELYAALDWLRERQGAIEAALAKRHLKGGTLVLYDVSSSCVEGRCCPLAKRGYSRDGKKGNAHIVYGLLCADSGFAREALMSCPFNRFHLAPTFALCAARAPDLFCD